MTTQPKKEMTTIRYEAEELMKKIVLTKKYPTTQIYDIYNRVFETSETPSSCGSCVQRKVDRIKEWLKIAK